MSVPLLNGRTRHVAKRAVHTAISRLGLKQSAAPLALVEILARIGGHVFRFLVSAGRTRDRRLENDRFTHEHAEE